MEIEFSAPLPSRAIIKSSEYFLFPEPKYPSTSFRLGRVPLRGVNPEARMP